MLIEAIALVVVLLVLFLGNLRAAIVVSVILPLAALATFGIMRWWGLTANIMSLGGLAIAIGLLVDCAVVVVENVEHRMAHAHDASLSERIYMTLEATREVAAPLTSGVDHYRHGVSAAAVARGSRGPTVRAGRAHHRLRDGFGALLVADRGAGAQRDDPAARPKPTSPGSCARSRPFTIRCLIARSIKPLSSAASRSGSSLAVSPLRDIGQTFMPVMNEGTPVITVRKHPTISVDVAAETDMRIQREIMSRVPEVKGMMARAGADELGIDPVGLNETDSF